MLVGAVVAGLDERKRPVDAEALELIERDAETAGDPVETLALSREARDLWSVIESGEAVEAFETGRSIAAIADRLATDWHDARLAALVGRLASRLPIAGFPSASAALAAACRAFERDKTVRRRLRAELLLDSLTTVVEALGAAV